MQTYEIQEATAAEKLESIGEHLDMLADEIDALEAQIADLDEAGVCTGTDYWREGTKLYANHGIDQACPIHGEPESSKRLRVYIGTNQEAQQEALAAIARCRQKADLEAQIRHIETRRGCVERAIAEAWHAAAGTQRWEV